MANATNYLEQAIYNHIFRGTTFSKPTPHIGLTLDVPGDSGNYQEVANSNGYARYANASGDAMWTAMEAPGSGQNVTEFSFGPATGDWGYVSGVVICDAATWGQGNSNVLLHGSLTTPRNVQNGDSFTFTAGNLKISIQ